MPTGGSIESVTIDGRYFAVASDADANTFLGGSTNEVEANGDGSGREIKTKMPWSVTGLTLSIDDAVGDQEFIQGLSDRIGFYPITVTYASGVVRQGSGKVVGDVQSASQSTTLPMDLKGTGKLTKQ